MKDPQTLTKNWHLHGLALHNTAHVLDALSFRQEVLELQQKKSTWFGKMFRSLKFQSIFGIRHCRMNCGIQYPANLTAKTHLCMFWSVFKLHSPAPSHRVTHRPVSTHHNPCGVVTSALPLPTTSRWEQWDWQVSTIPNTTFVIINLSSTWKKKCGSEALLIFFCHIMHLFEWSYIILHGYDIFVPTNLPGVKPLTYPKFNSTSVELAFHSSIRCTA